jgi:hypothetical protein
MSSQYGDPYEEWKAQGRPGGSFAAWQASQGGGAAPQVTGGSVAAPAATPGANTPGATLEQMIRQGAQGQSEDFARFNSGTVQGWGNQYYDAAASAAAGRPQFRSMRGQDGFFDKPTECPPGMGPSGPNETDPCTSQGYSQPAPSPLQNVMAPLQGQTAPPKAPWTPTDPASGSGGIYGGAMGGQGTIPGKVGVRESTPNPAGPYGGAMGGQNLPVPQAPTGPVQSSLTSLIAPLQSGFAAPTQPQSGLTNMLAGRQKRPGQWF